MDPDLEECRNLETKLSQARRRSVCLDKKEGKNVRVSE